MEQRKANTQELAKFLQSKMDLQIENWQILQLVEKLDAYNKGTPLQQHVVYNIFMRMCNISRPDKLAFHIEEYFNTGYVNPTPRDENLSLLTQRHMILRTMTYLDDVATISLEVK